MIEVKRLSKSFSSGVKALCDVSFTARPGGVLGFLGPNGAGKTTTLRILSGYLRPSGGSARVCGCDVVTDSMGARRRLGYLPEQVPLYGEMRVREYLRFRADLRGLSARERRGAIDAVLDEVGLVSESRRLIGQLSKGYRQRVGLADALLHRPAALILDEPTDGLDPNQRREVLDLITRLSAERTVVLSTHVLPEVETVCQQVVIIDRGKVVAGGATAELLAGFAPGTAPRIEIACRGDRAAIEAALLAVPAVVAVEAEAAPLDLCRFVVQLRREAGRADLTRADVDAACEALARAVLTRGELRRLSPARSSLETVFRWLTTGPSGSDAGPDATAGTDAGPAATAGGDAQ
jgi:ABC-2 type transport system ATP-binding protein